MIYHPIGRWRDLPGFPENVIWSAAFEWLEQASADTPAGIYPLGDDGFYARVMEYPLRQRDDGVYESHRKTIDIQMSLMDGEGIELSAPGMLQCRNNYSASADVEHFETPVSGLARVANIVGWFCVIFPGEPHMPQLTLTGIDGVRKVVVKIPAQLLTR